MIVRLLYPPAGLGAATAYLNSRAYPMTNEGDHFFAVVGLSTDFAIGQYPIDVSSDTALLATGLLTVNEGGFEFISIELPPSSIDLLQDQAAIAEERAVLAQTYANVTPAQQWSGAWIMPAQGLISNAFGLQRSINGGAYFPHTGTDIANEKGTPVVAAATGTVVLARPLYLYGNAVVIDHGAGVFTSYNHLDSITVATGQVVTIGDLIGYMGETGFVSGPHVHWEAVIRGVHTDPTIWTQAPIDP
jgi:murein DD-endopeptidase MepM/ murein hydrolase activator NlpD